MFSATKTLNKHLNTAIGDLGDITFEDYSTFIENCANMGVITGGTGDKSAGIVRQCPVALEIKNCVNIGKAGSNNRYPIAPPAGMSKMSNDVTAEGAGFGVDTNVVTFITKDECVENEIMSKGKGHITNSLPFVLQFTFLMGNIVV